MIVEGEKQTYLVDKTKEVEASTSKLPLQNIQSEQNLAFVPATEVIINIDTNTIVDKAISEENSN